MSIRDLRWPSSAVAVLERSWAHYGGVDAWRAIRTIRLVPDRVSGALPWLKGAGRTFPIPSAFEVAPAERLVRFLSYPDDRHIGIFQNGLVRIQRTEDARVVAEDRAHRASFRGLAKYRRWAPLDALYFFGYALAHYHSLPFSLADARLVRATTARTEGDRRDALEVEFPPEEQTHCSRQTFYFDDTGRLVCHDYHAEIVGWWARRALLAAPGVRQRFSDRDGTTSTLRIGRTAWPPVALHVTLRAAEIAME